MLLIRPVLRANANRRHKVHVVVFFIFLVSNIGGALTPLGDPPLFLGFLKGVDFFWPTVNMLPPMLMVASILLVVFYIFDSYYYRKEDQSDAPKGDEGEEPLGIEGGFNILLLAGVIVIAILWNRLKSSEPPFAGTIRELKKDGEWLQRKS